MLTGTQFIAAKDFIYKSARPLDIATFEYEFKDGERSKVIDILSSYQNPDGGFGNSLEPDIRLLSSSVMTSFVVTHISFIISHLLFSHLYIHLNI